MTNQCNFLHMEGRSRRDLQRIHRWKTRKWLKRYLTQHFRGAQRNMNLSVARRTFQGALAIIRENCRNREFKISEECLPQRQLVNPCTPTGICTARNSVRASCSPVPLQVKTPSLCAKQQVENASKTPSAACGNEAKPSSRPPPFSTPPAETSERSTHYASSGLRINGLRASRQRDNPAALSAAAASPASPLRMQRSHWVQPMPIKTPDVPPRPFTLSTSLNRASCPLLASPAAPRTHLRVAGRQVEAQH